MACRNEICSRNPPQPSLGSTAHATPRPKQVCFQLDSNGGQKSKLINCVPDVARLISLLGLSLSFNTIFLAPAGSGVACQRSRHKRDKLQSTGKLCGDFSCRACL